MTSTAAAFTTFTAALSTFTQAYAPAQQQIHGQAPQQSIQVSDPQ